MDLDYASDHISLLETGISTNNIGQANIDKVHTVDDMIVS